MMTTFNDYIGGKDIKWWDGGTRTFTRPTSTGGTLSQNKIGTMIDVLEVYGSATAYTLASINSALNAVGTSNVVFVLQQGTWTITDDLTIPATVTLVIPQGTTLSITAGKALTINGPVIAGQYQIFTSTGTVVLGTEQRECYAQWFGSDIDTVVSKLGSSEVDVIITKATTMTANTIIPATMRLVFQNGGSVNQGSNTFTINGPIEAGLYKIFDGTGTITFGVATVFAIPVTWFGATGDGATDDSVALQAAINAVNATNAGTVFFPPGDYHFATGLTINQQAIRLVGSGGGVFDTGAALPGQGSRLHYTGTGIAISVDQGRGMYMSDIHLTGTSSATWGIRFCTGGSNFAGPKMENMTISGFTKVGAAGWSIADSQFMTAVTINNVSMTSNYDGMLISGSGSTTIRTRDCSFTNNDRYGIYVTAGSGLYFDNCILQSNNADGIKVVPSGSASIDLTFNKPYFESNCTDTAGHHIHLEGASVADPLIDVRILSPTFNSGGAAMTQDINSVDAYVYIKWTRGVMIRDAHLTGDQGESVTVLQAGTNSDFRVEPEHTAQFMLGSVISQLHLHSSSIKGLWAFNEDFQGDVQVEDASGLDHHGVIADSKDRGNWRTAPCSLNFTGTEVFTVADHADFSFGDGASTDTAFSVVVLTKVASSATQIFLGKHDATTGAEQVEWYVGLDGSDYPFIYLHDALEANREGTVSDVAITKGKWQTITYVYRRTAAQDNTDLEIFINGITVAVTGSTQGTYVAMHNTTAPVGNFYEIAGGTISGYNEARHSIIMIVGEALTAAKIRAIDNLLRGYSAGDRSLKLTP